VHRDKVPTIGAAWHPDHVPAPLRQGGMSVRDRRPPREPRAHLTEGGRTKTITLSTAEVREVAAALARYEAARAELQAQAEAGLARLRSRRGGENDAAGGRG
jgi:hypothetical protein